MQGMPAEVTDGFIIAAILQSDAAVHAVQRELKLAYPNLIIPSDTIRQVLRDKVMRPDILDDAQIKTAYALLAQVNALSADTRRARKTGMLPPLPVHEPDEHVNDTLWHDKTQAGGGG